LRAFQNYPAFEVRMALDANRHCAGAVAFDLNGDQIAAVPAAAPLN
jgi:succinate dehydrogenase/fumarate reductase flavoprotein subunit